MITNRFLRLSQDYLDEYLTKIRSCVARLDEQRVWWRPHAGANSVGNLVLHLVGNLSQWIVAGLGGTPDTRRRSQEFAAEGGLGNQELLERLSQTVASCTATLARLSDRDLAAARRIQGIDTDGLGVVLHAVEHMSYHTGQIVLVTKQLLGEDSGIDFYPQHAGE